MKRYRSIILHVGLSKTGTTSIQNNCQFRHHELLARCGYHYASFRCDGKLRPNHGGPITAALFDNPDRYGPDWRASIEADPAYVQRTFRSYFRDLLRKPKAENLVLSGEVLSRYRVPDLEMLRDRLLPHTERLRTLVYLRSPLGFIESVTQARTRAGRSVTPGSLVGLMSMRYARLRHVFGERLETHNYDACSRSSLGLVGSFLETCGLPRDTVEALEFSTHNRRISMEAFLIMEAINTRLPRSANDHGFQRQKRDMKSLSSLPGRDFRLHDFVQSPDYSRACAEKSELEGHLGMQFDDLRLERPADLWQFDTLAALERSVKGLEEPELRQAAVDYLGSVADGLAYERPQTSTILSFVRRCIVDNDDSLT